MPAPLRPDGHAPLPWKYVPWHIEEGPSAVRAPEGWLLANTSSDADAEFIVRACNAHYELLAALKAFNFSESAIIGGTADTLTLRVPIKTLQDAAAAIARAESGL